ncbi:alcohol dehydrogenase catalytic domain-containing protein [Enhygromyxa salina]|uniref:alcohol dehydrogenase catalytic domain-containing protein n=1 Tax=Enhygromyxa salina TaxID=215803 RepID=UPI000D08D633|nr:alcohol dehydrogenase catalytic domain-containing protein [Enhygromyxa salina]
MRALILDPAGELRVRDDHPEPVPAADEALIHVRRAGVCDTDLQLVDGYAGFEGVLGHEFVGLVDAADPELGGRRVVADINIGCGACPACTHGDGHHCRARATIGIRGRPGVFAERVALPRRNLVPVPETVDDELAVFAEPLAAALHVLDELEPGPGEVPRVDVLGDGKLGLLIGLALHAAGQPVRAIGHHRAKLDVAAALGIETSLERELDARDQGAAALVVEATGHPSGLSRALWLARPRGAVILKTTSAAPIPLDLSTVVVNELRVIGSRCGDMARAVDLLARGGLDPRPLIAARYPLARATEALEHASRRGVLKVLVDPGC